MPEMLSPQEFKTRHLHGVFAAIPLPWRDDDSLDDGLLRDIVFRYKSAGVHGVYTTGTDGELSALDFDDFAHMVDVFARATEDAGIPAQVGVTWVHTKGVLQRIAHAVERGIGVVQVAMPFWTVLNDEEVRRFFVTIAERFPDVGLIHYNNARARFFHGTDYERLLPEVPTLIGSKHTGGNVEELMGCVRHAPSMHHFVVDGQMVPGALLGAKGVYSFTVNLNPVWEVAFWDACSRGDWVEAARRKELESRFFETWSREWGPITASQSLAHLATRCGIAPEMGLRVRAPYLYATEEQEQGLRALLDGEFAELRYRPA